MRGCDARGDGGLAGAPPPVPLPGAGGEPAQNFFSPRFGAAALCCGGAGPGGGQFLPEPFALSRTGQRGDAGAGAAVGGLPRVFLPRRFPGMGKLGSGEGCASCRVGSRAGRGVPAAPGERLWALGCGGQRSWKPRRESFKRGTRVSHLPA